MVALAAIVGKPWVGGRLHLAISDAARSALPRLSRRGAPTGVKRSRGDQRPISADLGARRCDGDRPRLHAGDDLRDRAPERGRAVNAWADRADRVISAQLADYRRELAVAMRRQSTPRLTFKCSGCGQVFSTRAMSLAPNRCPRCLARSGIA
jgi:hypothetical protein